MSEPGERTFTLRVTVMRGVEGTRNRWVTNVTIVADSDRRAPVSPCGSHAGRSAYEALVGGLAPCIDGMADAIEGNGEVV